MLSSIWTGCLLKGKAEAASVFGTGCAGCGMGCAIGRIVELESKVEIDQLLARLECR